jgi:hypothetical protein
MNRRGTGVSLLAIAAILFSTKYISAAIYGSNVEAWKIETFEDQLNNMGNFLDYLSFLSLVLGVGYLIIAEIKRN